MSEADVVACDARSGVRQSERLDYKGSDAPPDDSRTKGEEDGDEEEPRKGVLHSDKMIRNMFIHKVAPPDVRSGTPR